MVRDHQNLFECFDMTSHSTPASPRPEVSDDELLQVIADFLAMGHVENIVAMFRQEPRYFAWTGQLLTDERFAVRLGVAVLFEHLIDLCPEHLPLAIPGLVDQLRHPEAWVRGEAVSVLGMIGTEAALAPLPAMQGDSSPQVVEIVRDILGLPAH
jgi:HEAT repeat protein